MRGYGRNNRDYADRWWGWDRTREHFIVGQESGIARPYYAHKKGNTEEADDVEAAKAAPAKKTRSRKSKQEKDEEWESRFKAKFVNLADILPPIPAKGSFDVNEIKRSKMTNLQIDAQANQRARRSIE